MRVADEIYHWPWPWITICVVVHEPRKAAGSGWQCLERPLAAWARSNSTGDASPFLLSGRILIEAPLAGSSLVPSYTEQIVRGIYFTEPPAAIPKPTASSLASLETVSYHIFPRPPSRLQQLLTRTTKLEKSLVLPLPYTLSRVSHVPILSPFRTLISKGINNIEKAIAPFPEHFLAPY
ncbi:hypothetical protein VUR80DRAFT_3962 [Thermomyces stellatus]